MNSGKPFNDDSLCIAIFVDIWRVVHAYIRRGHFQTTLRKEQVKYVRYATGSSFYTMYTRTTQLRLKDQIFSLNPIQTY